MMSGQVTAAVIAREATHRKLTEPPREPRPRRPRRAAARALQAVALRLDPCVAPPPRAPLGRDAGTGFS
jgi:hypothetical protein